MKNFWNVNVIENSLTSLLGVAGFITLYGQQLLDFLKTDHVTDLKSLAHALVILFLGLASKHK